jgi:ATP-dependent RNA helicase DDX5/DBP2
MNQAQPVDVKGSGNIPGPWNSFEQVQFPRNLIEPMLEAKFQRPSLIQAHSWPILGTGRDVIGIAKTGSGKTLGFLLPGFTKMLVERLGGSPIMLVMAPTRELAVQIDADARKFASSAGIVTALAYGGAPKRDQLNDIRRRPHLLVGTPGRLNDFLEARQIDLRDTKFLVLDEADRMLDMGFEPQIRKIVGSLSSRRQTLMFTATWPKEIRRIASDFFHDPIEIRIGNTDELQANTDIDQQIFIVRDMRDKERRLQDCLRNCVGQAIVFVSTKRACESLGSQLQRMGVGCETIHGDRDQQARDRALQSFKQGNQQILVATDVAARGLDVKAVKLVVNFDPANNAEEYVHRIGRTGRAGNKGTAITFLMENEGKKANDVMQVMQTSGKTVPPELESLAKGPWGSGGRGGKGGGGKGGGGKGGGKRDRSRSRGRGGW